MAVDMEQVRAALDPEEPDYPAAAASLGPEALPHLETIITGDHIGLAAKAAYLAGLIGTDQSVPAMEKAARNAATQVRIAAAAAVPNLPLEHSEPLMLQLVDDADPGVRKVAVRSAPLGMSDALRARVAAHSAAVDAGAGAATPRARAAAKGGGKKPRKTGAKKAAAKTSARKGGAKARKAGKAGNAATKGRAKAGGASKAKATAKSRSKAKSKRKKPR